MSNTYEGDPKLYIDKNGSYLDFRGGQPVMDQGLENMAVISLLTKKGWHGNVFLNNVNKIGSDFEEVAKKSITSTSLENTKQAVERALDKPVFGKKIINVENPINYRVDVDIIIEPPGSDTGHLVLEKNGENWLFQKTNPANER